MNTSHPLSGYFARPGRRSSIRGGDQGRSQQGTGGQAARRPSSRSSATGSLRRTAANKVIMLDGRPWVASKDNPTKLLRRNARANSTARRTKS